MAETVSVSVSGPAFSFLLYENARSTYDQEGFLLGQFLETQKKSITDNDVPSVHTERKIIVNSVVPCPRLCYFYNGAGMIDGDKISSFLDSQTTKVIGWYKFKHGSSSVTPWKLTLREKIVHKQLANSFDIPADLFLMCLLTLQSNVTNSTHIYKQTFIRYYDPIYQQIPMHIVNLSDPNTSYETPIPSSDTFKNILASLKMDTKKMQGLEAITKIQNALQAHIDKVVENLSESEKKMHELEREVADLEERLRYKKQNERARSPSLDMSIENGLPSDKTFSSSSHESSPEKERKVMRGRGRGRGVIGAKNNMKTVSPNRKPLEIVTRDTPIKTRAGGKSNLTYSQATQKAKN